MCGIRYTYDIYIAVVIKPSEIKSIATFITYGFTVFGKFTDWRINVQLQLGNNQQFYYFSSQNFYTANK